MSRDLSRTSRPVGYDDAFAVVYDRYFSNYARTIAPVIESYVSAWLTDRRRPKKVLDLCCGTGQVARHFVSQGYAVTGLDASEAMLKRFTAKVPQARAIHDDARGFSLADQYPSIIATDIALAHLGGVDGLTSALASSYDAAEQGGVFVFDLPTGQFLSEWAQIHVVEVDTAILVIRGHFDRERCAGTTYISGAVLDDDGQWRRFAQYIEAFAFTPDDVAAAAEKTGWRVVAAVRPEDFGTAVVEAGEVPRIVYVTERL